MGKQKIARKKLLKEPDEFLSFSSRLLQLASAHSLKVLWGIGILFAVLAIVSTVRFISVKSERQASLLLTQTLEKYARTLTTQGAAEALKSVEPDFTQILERYSSKPAGKRARVYFANMCYAAGDADKAIELYKQAIDDWTDAPSIRNLVLSSLAYAYEKKSDLQAAAQTLELVQTSSDRMGREFAIFNLGRIYAKLGETQKSEAAFKTVATDYPDSMYGQVAKEKAET